MNKVVIKHPRIAEEANIVAEYADLSIEFGSKPSDREGCCVITWGNVGAPHDTHKGAAVVSMAHVVGRFRNCPDKSKLTDLVFAITAADPDFLLKRILCDPR